MESDALGRGRGLGGFVGEEGATFEEVFLDRVEEDMVRG